MKKLLFIYNPKAGKQKISSYFYDMINLMSNSKYEVTIYSTKSKADAEQKIIETKGIYDKIICSGGDGTFHEIINGMIKSKQNLPIGYIPFGSTNDYGKSIGLNINPIEATKIALSDNEIKCDIGKFKDKYFLYVAAFGLFSDVSYKTSQEDKNMLGHAAYILEGAKSLTTTQSYKLTVNVNGQTFTDEFVYGMITNSKSVGGFSTIIEKDVDLMDGLFEVVLVKKPNTIAELSEALMCLVGGIEESNMIYKFKTAQITLTSKENISWSIDGEDGGKHKKVIIENIKQAIRVNV